MPAKRTPIAPWLRLVREPSLYQLPVTTIRSPEDVYGLLKPRLEVEEVEVFLVLMLDTKAKVRAITEVSRGTLNSSMVHPRETFRAAIAYGAEGIILSHNHPSGDPTPSAEDVAVTRALVEAGELIGIPVYDHVIVAGESFVSFATRGLIS
jgi:DNA repair protein RadC